MGLEDIVLGVGIDSGGVASGITAVFDVIAEQSAQAIADFNALEAQADSLGTTLEALSGITSDVSDVYRDFNAQTARMSVNLQAVRITAMAPLISEFGELARVVDNAAGKTRDFQRDVTFGKAAKAAAGVLTGVTQFNLAKDFVFGKAVRRVSDTEREARNAVLDAQARAIEARRLELTGEANERFGESRQEAIERFETGVGTRGRRAGLAAHFRDRRSSDQEAFRGVDREAFLRSQAVRQQNDFSGTVESRARRDRVALEQFDLRQAAARKKQDIREQTAGDKSLASLDLNNKIQLEKLEGILRELQEQRREDVREISQATDAEILEDI
jgi:hypothetical protein